MHHDAWWGFFHLLPIVLFLVAIGVAIWAVLRISSGPVVSSGAAAVMAAPVRDPAVEELRIRYARGELGRDDFAQRMRDLGSHDIGSAQPSPTPDEAPPASGDASVGDG